MGFLEKENRREEFRTTRLQLGMSQAQLGSLMGISASNVSAIETGRGCRAPTRVHMRFLAMIKRVIESGIEISGE